MKSLVALLVGVVLLGACSLDPLVLPMRRPRDAGDVPLPMDVSDGTTDGGDVTAEAPGSDREDTASMDADGAVPFDGDVLGDGPRGDGPEGATTAPTCPSTQTLCGVECATLGTDPNHCGRCGNACVFANATGVCVAGACTLVACASGFGDCDGNPANGCEADTRTSTAHCGRCGDGCAFANAAASCAGGACVLGACATGFADCDRNPANGCEVDTRSSALHCNECGRACPSSGGTPVCVAGLCRATMCPAGRGDCDGFAANGCEADLQTDRRNCGACGSVCAFPNAGVNCAAGRCVQGACDPGFADCNGSTLDGCEVSLTAACTSAGSGGCQSSGLQVCAGMTAGCSARPRAPGSACTTPMGGSCDAAGACGCTTGRTLCGAACVDLARDPLHCGACGAACSSRNGTPSCVGRGCTILCAPGFGDCDATAATGCEVDTRTSTAHCGRCGNACAFANATANCVGGACMLGACNAGFADCDANPANGCEASLQSSTTCGRCGNVCSAGMVCDMGLCSLRCPTGQVVCAGACVDPTRDARHCGMCGRACSYPNALGVCASSVCSLGACVEGFGNCNGDPTDGCEVNLVTVSNCGLCGHVCGSNHATPVCLPSRVCELTCVAGYLDCDADSTDGCEVDARTTANCGACGRTCFPPGATGTCAAGTCGIAMCNTNLANCNGMMSDGCEANLATDRNNCGACGTVCATNVGTTSNFCTARVCAPACSASFGNCDGNPNNGCETDLRTSNTNCGACGNVCTTNVGTTSNVCTAGTCVAVCAESFGDCDASRGNGCETRLNTDTRCGGCGTMCTASATSCRTFGSTFSCQSCGAMAQPCCTSGTPCAAPFSCIAGVCN